MVVAVAALVLFTVFLWGVVLMQVFVSMLLIRVGGAVGLVPVPDVIVSGRLGVAVGSPSSNRPVSFTLFARECYVARCKLAQWYVGRAKAAADRKAAAIGEAKAALRRLECHSFIDGTFEVHSSQDCPRNLYGGRS